MENKVSQLEKRYQSANDENKRLKRRLDSLEHIMADVEETKQLVEKTRKKTKKLRKKQTQFEQIVVLAATTL
jgi:prefoldin subunit 5